MTLMPHNALMARRLLARALLTCIGLTAPAAAWALPMYAYSKDELSSVIVQTGTERNGFVTLFPVLGSGVHQAVHGGDGLDSQGPGADPPQAKSGPGPFPGENSFAPSGERGAYARADTCVFAASACDGVASNVAEVFRPRPGEDLASANVLVRWDIKVKAGDDLRVSFWAWPDMRVKTSGDREIARALFDVFLSVVAADDADQVFLVWQPCGDADNSECRTRDPLVSVFDISDPFDLHQFIECTGVCEKQAPATGEAPSRFEISIRGLGGAEGRDVVLFLDATEGVRVLIPEPGSLWLLAAGVLAAWMCRSAAVRRPVRT